ncbi:MAG: hypothetical protein ACI4PO_09085 [Faecousia sp.]
MSFRPQLRPGQGAKLFRVLRRVGGTTNTGRPTTSSLASQGEFYGIISQASPHEIEQHKQLGSPITHTIVQRWTKFRAKPTDILELDCGDRKRRFMVQGDPKDPGELGHFLIYTVEERDDLQ